LKSTLGGLRAPFAAGRPTGSALYFEVTPAARFPDAAALIRDFVA
jgi:hypothetical protein